MYWIPVIISILITLIASAHVRSTFSKYKRVANSRGITGAEAARQMLMAHGIYNVTIEPCAGSLTDYFDPSSNTIRLSEDVFNVASVAAVGIAMHETGHAVQHAEGYTPVRIRSAIVKSTNISSWVSYFLVLLGIMFSATNLISLGIIAFCAVIFFQIVTLPVEFDASSRALRMIQEYGMADAEDLQGCRTVLTAAALTYVAGVASSFLQILRLVMLYGGRRNRRD